MPKTFEEKREEILKHGIPTELLDGVESFAVQLAGKANEEGVDRKEAGTETEEDATPEVVQPEPQPALSATEIAAAVATFIEDELAPLRQEIAELRGQMKELKEAQETDAVSQQLPATSSLAELLKEARMHRASGSKETQVEADEFKGPTPPAANTPRTLGQLITGR